MKKQITRSTLNRVSPCHRGTTAMIGPRAVAPLKRVGTLLRPEHPVKKAKYTRGFEASHRTTLLATERPQQSRRKASPLARTRRPPKRRSQYLQFRRDRCLHSSCKKPSLIQEPKRLLKELPPFYGLFDSSNPFFDRPALAGPRRLLEEDQ